MKVWTRFDNYVPDTKKPLVLALGNFDGVHLGHRGILGTVVENARQKQGTPAVLTFFEHPQRVLHQSQKPALLTSPQHRLLLLKSAGIEICFFLHFTLELSRTTPEEFVEKWLVKRLQVNEVHMGYNAHFGFNRRGDSALMRKLAGELGFQFCEAEAVKGNGEFISSTLIREVIQQGEFTRAERLLGRPFSIFGSVVRGKGRGKRLGFPTANLRVHSEILPPRGVYPVELRERGFHLESLADLSGFEYELDEPGKWRHGILNFGVRPTFGEETSEPVPEVHLFDFNGELYGRTVEVRFHPRLREEKAFKSENELMKAIQEDIGSARRYFARPRGPLQREGNSAIL